MDVTAQVGAKAGWNWAQTYEFTATALHHPTSIDQVAQLVTSAASAEQTVRCIGSRHSFTSIGDANMLIDLSSLPERCDFSEDRGTVTVNSAMIYSRLASLLAPKGLAVANLASLPHISIAGATATATHGSGDRNGNLSTAVKSLEIATSDGKIRFVAEGDPDFSLAPIALGALGAVLAVEIEVQPAFNIEQQVHDDVSWRCLDESFDAIFGAAYSVSAFTDWRNHLQLWTKRRLDQPAVDHESLHDGTPATAARHPIPGVDAQACTAQGPAGLWSDRLPHFRAGATPSIGAEVQSEFFVDREHALEAIGRLRSIGADLSDSLMASEIRTVRQDDLWLSPQYHRNCVAFHFTWQHDMSAALQASRRVADALAGLAPLPHWGKVFDPDQFDFDALYPRLADARRVFTEWDPQAVFSNTWMRETIQKQS